MAGNIESMDYAAIQALITQYTDASARVTRGGQSIVMSLTALKSSSFKDTVGSAAYNAFENTIQPRITAFAKQCDTRSTELRDAMSALRKADSDAAALPQNI